MKDLQINRTNTAMALLADADIDRLLRTKHGKDRTFRDHLLGVFRILDTWGEKPNVCLGGLLHSIYGTEWFHSEDRVGLARRNDIANLIGPEAERLAFLFSVIDRRKFLRLLEAQTQDEELVRIPMRDGFENIESGDALTKMDCRNLLAIIAANLVEQTHGPRNTEIDLIRSLIQYGCLMATRGTVPGALKLLMAQGLDSNESQRLMTAYGELSNGGASVRGLRYLSSFNKKYLTFPDLRLIQAMHLHDLGIVSESRQLAKDAAKLLKLWGCTWDKRMSFEDWIAVAERLQSKSKTVDVTIRQQLDLDPKEPSDSFASGRFLEYVEGFRRSADRRLKRLYPRLSRPNEERLASSRFSIVGELEKRVAEIKSEIQKLPEDVFFDEAEPIQRSGKWGVVLLFEAGVRIEQNCEKLPTLTKVLESSRDLKSAGSMAYVSRLAPGTRIAAHRGPTNTRVRCHLPISIPSGDCGMRVGKHLIKWTEGKCIVFDDSYDHEVWNNTDAERVVVVIDLWHPGLRDIERSALDGLEHLVNIRAESLNAYRAANQKERADGMQSR